MHLLWVGVWQAPPRGMVLCSTTAHVPVAATQQGRGGGEPTCLNARGISVGTGQRLVKQGGSWVISWRSTVHDTAVVALIPCQLRCAVLPCALCARLNTPPQAVMATSHALQWHQARKSAHCSTLQTRASQTRWAGRSTALWAKHSCSRGVAGAQRVQLVLVCTALIISRISNSSQSLPEVEVVLSWQHLGWLAAPSF